MIQRIGYAVTAAFAVFLFYYVGSYYFSFPFADHLDLLILLKKHFENQLSPADFFAPHGASHWHAGAYAVLVPLALLTHWNTAYEVGFNLLFGMGTFLALLVQIRRSPWRSPASGWLPVALMLLGFIVFSVDQIDNWLWGWQLSVQMCVFGVTAGIILLCSRELPVWKLFLAVLLGCLATYNFSTALCYWPVGLGILLLHPHLGGLRKRAYAAVWSLCLASMAVQYYWTFIDLIVLTQKPAPVIERLLFASAFVPAYLGCGIARFTTNGYLAVLLGAAGVLYFLILGYILAVRRKHALEDLLAYLALGVFAMGGAFITGLGRMDFGLKQAAVFRYVSFSNLFWLSVLILSLTAWFHSANRIQRKTRLEATAAMLLILLFKLCNQGYAFLLTQERHLQMSKLRSDIVAYYPDYQGTDIDFDLLYFNRELGLEYLRLLHDHQLSVFAPAEGSQPGRRGSDRINEGP